MQRFAAVMRDLAAYIEAERDLEHCDSCDPSCDAWLLDAERAREAVLGCLAVLDLTPVHARHDMPLRRYGQLTRILIECDTPAEFLGAFGVPERFPDHFRCHHSNRMARRVNLMINAFKQHLDALATLSDFADLIDANHIVIDADVCDSMISSAA